MRREQVSSGIGRRYGESSLQWDAVRGSGEPDPRLPLRRLICGREKPGGSPPNRIPGNHWDAIIRVAFCSSSLRTDGYAWPASLGGLLASSAIGLVFMLS